MDSMDFQQKDLGKRLNRDKVKLWLPPYTLSDGERGDYSQEFLQKYSSELCIAEEKVHVLLEGLRQHALQKISEREKFQKSGLATIKLKVSGLPDPQKGNNQNVKQCFDIEISLDQTGAHLKELIAAKLGIHSDHLKLIYAGKVLKNDGLLKEQNVKNGVTLLVLCLSVSQSMAEESDKNRAKVRDTRHTAELLSARVEQDTEFGDVDVQIADQSGRPLKLPPAEKKALTLAMTLHEKGRSVLKQKNVTLALPLLLEADKEFSLCRADILNYVDNYAVLCLDIVWCYLCLKNVEDLPDAEERLQNSEAFFKKCYGSDMQRLVAVKGGSGKELALFMRLHLLQGIVAFHQGKLSQAGRLLYRAEEELNRLCVEEDKLTEVMGMGFEEREARLGLRSSGGNIERAITHIMKRKEEKADIAKKVKEERKKKQLAKKLGKTASGQLVNTDHYTALINMGYPKGTAAEALKQANNNMNMALEVIHLHPELLNLPDPETLNNCPVQITDEMIAQLFVLGYEAEMIHRALMKTRGDVEKAARELLQNNGIIEPIPEPLPESTASPSDPSTSTGGSKSKTPDELREEKAAINRLLADLDQDEEDYLDLELRDEAEFLQQYKALLLSVSPQHKLT